LQNFLNAPRIFPYFLPKKRNAKTSVGNNFGYVEDRAVKFA